MQFENLHIKDVTNVVSFTPNSKQWVAKDRDTHFIGISLKGKVIHTFENQEFTLSENCIYFFNQKDNYKTFTLEQSEAFSIHFTTYENISTDSFYVAVSNRTNIVSLLQKAQLLYKNKDTLALYSVVYALCSEISNLKHRLYFPKDKRMQKAKEYIDSNFLNNNCISEATKESNLTPRRFGELFRKNYNVTPHGYIVQLKIENAKKLLSSGEYSVNRVASLCNFSDAYYFSKVFKKETGVAPSKWKN